MSKITSTTPMAPSESPSEPSPSPDSRSSCDGWRPKPRHDGRPRVPAHRLRAYQPASPVNLAKMARQRAQQRWRRAAHAHCQAGACYARCDAPVVHANACFKDAFSRAFRKPVLRCRGPDTFAAWSSGEHKSWRRSLRQEALSQPTAAAGRCMMVSHASRLRGFARLFQAKRPHLASCQGRSSTEDELCGESDWNSCVARGCWRRSR
jgi:hypothetical protein